MDDDGDWWTVLAGNQLTRGVEKERGGNLELDRER